MQTCIVSVSKGLSGGKFISVCVKGKNSQLAAAAAAAAAALPQEVPFLCAEQKKSYPLML